MGTFRERHVNIEETIGVLLLAGEEQFVFDSNTVVVKMGVAAQRGLASLFVGGHEDTRTQCSP